MKNLSYHDVARVLKADFETGRLFWLPRTPDLFLSNVKRTAEHSCRIWNTRYANQEAMTCIIANGYRTGNIFAHDYYAHRVLWLLYTGDWPVDQIDHIDGNRINNSIINLRMVSNVENHKNMKMNKRNTSGVHGVFWAKHAGKWRASIKIDDYNKHLGYFESIEDAAIARKSAEIEYGFHENHGRFVACRA